MAKTTRERILDAALGCFLEAGYEQTTIASIRERSGISNGAVFHHFATKEAIADALYVDAMAAFQQGLWEIVRARPRSLRSAVRAVITHQLQWIEEHPDQARWVYQRGHLELDAPSSAQLDDLNRTLAAAFSGWMDALANAGQMRRLPMLLVTAIVTGPTHAIARRWLAGQLRTPLRDYADELTDAACGALGEAPARRSRYRHRAPAAAAARIRLELLDEDGALIGAGNTNATIVAASRS